MSRGDEARREKRIEALIASGWWIKSTLGWKMEGKKRRRWIDDGWSRWMEEV